MFHKSHFPLPLPFVHLCLVLVSTFPEKYHVVGIAGGRNGGAGGLNSWSASSSRSHMNSNRGVPSAAGLPSAAGMLPTGEMHYVVEEYFYHNDSFPYNNSTYSANPDIFNYTYTPTQQEECTDFYFRLIALNDSYSAANESYKALKCIYRELVDLKTLLTPTPAPAYFDDIIPSNYDKLEVPVIVEMVFKNVTDDDNNNTNSTPIWEDPEEKVHPMQILLFLNIGGITEFNEKEDFIGFDMEVISGWTDEKIRRQGEMKSVPEKDLYYGGEMLEKIWAPDFFLQEIAIVNNPKVQLEPKTVVINPGSGYVKFKQRLILMLYCDFDFYYYPADTQQCPFKIRSYTYSTHLVNLSWALSGVYMHRSYDYNFEYQVVSATQYENVVPMGPLTNSDEKYATLEFVVKARRKLSYHMVQTYVPSVLLEVVTWVCFLIPRDQSEVRVGLSMTTLLTMTSLFNSVRASTPTVSYMKAIDIWMLGCIVFLFLKLTGFITIAWLKSKKGKEFLASSDNTTFPPITENEMKKSEPEKSKNSRKMELDETLDKILVFLMPSTFTICVILYWLWLLMASNYYTWTMYPELNNLKDIPDRVKF